MEILRINTIKYEIGDRQLLDINNLLIDRGEKIGLIGDNGVGKSTLLRILNGDLTTDSSDFHIYGQTGLLPQIKDQEDAKSGGEITQRYIVDLFTKNVKLFFLDEPTNNLDIGHIDWLEKKINNSSESMIIVDHNRYFLDKVCDKIWELSDTKITCFVGNYTSYKEQKESLRKTQLQAYDDYIREKEHLEMAILNKKRQAHDLVKKPKNISYSEYNAKGAKPHFGKVQKSVYQNAKALESRLGQLEKVERPKEEVQIYLPVPSVKAYRHKFVIKADRMMGRVAQKSLWQAATFFVKGGDKIGIVGANGCGKTTLLKKILNQEDVYVSPYVKIGYFDQQMSQLKLDKTIWENVTETQGQKHEIIKKVLMIFGFKGQDFHKKVNVLSGGERVKLVLTKLLVGDFNTLLLDEPTSHLDAKTIEALEMLLQNYEGTVLLVSHDKQFMSRIVTKILAIADKKMTMFDGKLEDFEEKQKTSASNQELLDFELTKTLSQLSVAPSEELEARYLQLLAVKNAQKV